VGQASRLSTAGKMPVPPRPGRALGTCIPSQEPGNEKQTRRAGLSPFDGPETLDGP